MTCCTKFYKILSTSYSYTSILSLIKPLTSEENSSELGQLLSTGIQGLDQNLASHYITGLTEILGTVSTKSLSSNLKDVLLSLLVKNTLKLLRDDELPLSIKSLFLNRLTATLETTQKMFSRPETTLLLDIKGKELFPGYKEIALQLRERLIKDKDQAGITFKGRSIKLFMWCQQELTETRNPLVNLFLTNPKIDKSKNYKHSFDQLDNILNILILFIGACDDIADTIQDEKVTLIFEKIPYCSTQSAIDQLGSEIKDFRDGMFTDYFENAVSIWKDAVLQLEKLFGKDYFDSNVKPQFLKIFESIVRSLSYSVYLNTRPHSSDITVDKIREILAPNIMVCCFRYLEQALVFQLLEKEGLPTPSPEDLSKLDTIIRMAQSNAASSNAAATASRELQKENDISSEFPFAMNTIFLEELSKTGVTFVKEFCNFIESKGYQNGFLATYYENVPSDFDYLTLLVLRRTIFEKIISELDRFKKRGFPPTDSDYEIDSIASHSIKVASESSNENLLKGGLLAKYKRHIELINLFTEHLIIKTDVFTKFFANWEKEITSMRELSEAIEDPLLRQEVTHFIHSWENFLLMYLLFKKTFDGTI
jgi:hypothetical protein